MPQPWPAVSPVQTKLCLRGARPLLSRPVPLAETGGGTEGALGGFAGVAVGVLEVQGEREPGAGREVLGVDPGGEVGGFAASTPPQHPLEGAAAAERGTVLVHREQVGHQPAGPRRTGPQHAGIGGDIAGGDAGREGQAVADQRDAGRAGCVGGGGCGGHDGGSTGGGQGTFEDISAGESSHGFIVAVPDEPVGRGCERLNAAGLPPTVRAGCAEAIS